MLRLALGANGWFFGLNGLEYGFDGFFISFNSHIKKMLFIKISITDI